MMGAINIAMAIIQLINAAQPGIAQIILRLKKSDGTTVDIPLDEAFQQIADKFEANSKQIDDWLLANPKTSL
jgi:hypothetical protein